MKNRKEPPAEYRVWVAIGLFLVSHLLMVASNGAGAWAWFILIVPVFLILGSAAIRPNGSKSPNDDNDRSQVAKGTNLVLIDGPP